MGRPCKLTPELINQASDLIGQGLPYYSTAAACGISTATFMAWKATGHEHRASGIVSRFSEFIEAIEKASAQLQLSLLSKITSAAESSHQQWTAAAWVLERRFPAEYGRDRSPATAGSTVNIAFVPMANAPAISVTEVNHPQLPPGIKQEGDL